MWVAGVDGCRSGWLAALQHPGTGEVRIRIHADLQSLLDAPEAPRIIAIDMPIGLPDRIDGPGRAAEQAVRPLLGGRQSSVFSIPSREAVYAGGYREGVVTFYGNRRSGGVDKRDQAGCTALCNTAIASSRMSKPV